MLEQLAEYIHGHAPAIVLLILGITGSLVYLGLAIVLLTPSKDDDAWVEAQKQKPWVSAALKFVMGFSPLAKKSEGGVGLAVQPTDKPSESKPNG